MCKAPRRYPRLREVRHPRTDEIKILLLRQELTITILAQEIGRHPQYVRAVINGRQSSIEVHSAIADRLGVPLDSIFSVAESYNTHKAARKHDITRIH